MAKLMLGTQEVSPALYSEGYKELPSYQVSNGVASKRSKVLDGTEFSDITSVGDNALSYAFYERTGLVGDLNLSSITSVGIYGLYYTFCGCTGIKNADLSSVLSIGLAGVGYLFYGCTSLENIYLDSLNSIGATGFSSTFYGCKSLKNIYFNSLKTNSFYNLGVFMYMFNSTTGSSSGGCIVHFPSNLQSTISGLTGYPTFGGSSSYITLSFDLPETS